MSVIYEPKGAAKEYSPLACNLYTGCQHGCDYCYVPGIPPWKFKKQPKVFFHESSYPRKDILVRVEKAAKKMAGDPREILFCFTCDPFQCGRDNSVTMEALMICEKYQLKCQILTKGGSEAMEAFGLIQNNCWKFGTTLHLSQETDRQRIEPRASSIEDRIGAIMAAHSIGIYTWVSIEPVIYPSQALEVIERLREHVDLFKVGKLNHDPKREATVDWGKFHGDVLRLLEGKDYIIKNALKGYAPTGGVE